MPYNKKSLENLEKSRAPGVKKKSAATKSANVKAEKLLFAALRKELVDNQNKTGESNTEVFIQKFIQQAKKNPNGTCGKKLADVIFQESLYRDMDTINDRDKAQDEKFQRYCVMEKFYQEERNILLEINHSKRIIACCSRQVGKTETAAGSIIMAAIIPNSRILYINLTFANAIRQIFDRILHYAQEANLQIKSSSRASGEIEFVNGSSVRIMGNSTSAESEKIRGETKVSLIVVDEAFHEKNLDYLINEAAQAATSMRALDATILLIGTPPRIPHTYGEQVWSKTGWRKYSWDMRQNPYQPFNQPGTTLTFDEYIKDIAESRGVSVDSPFIQREYFGKIGCYDTEAMVFKGRKTFTELSGDEPITDIAIGVDYGDSAFNAMVTVIYNKNTKWSRVIKTDKVARTDVSEIISIIKSHYDLAVELCKKHKVDHKEHIKIYADTSHEQITRELMIKHKLPAFNCYKYDKYYALELLAEELRTGRMQIPENGILDEEMQQILYKRDEDTDAILPELDEEQGIHPDAAFALLYASRKVFFDMDYDIEFKESQPETNTVFKKTESGVILGIKPIEPEQEFEDSGVIG